MKILVILTALVAVANSIPPWWNRTDSTTPPWPKGTDSTEPPWWKRMSSTTPPWWKRKSSTTPPWWKRKSSTTPPWPKGTDSTALPWWKRMSSPPWWNHITRSSLVSCFLCQGNVGRNGTCWNNPYMAMLGTHCYGCVTIVRRDRSRPWEEGKVFRDCLPPGGQKCGYLKLGSTTVYRSCCYRDRCNTDQPAGSHSTHAKFWLTSVLLSVAALISV